LILLSVFVVNAFPSPGGRIAGAALAVAVTASVLLHVAFYPSPLDRLIPSGTSQNVYAHVEPRGRVTRTVVLTGHVDTHRTPIAFRSPRIFRLFRRLSDVGTAAIVLLAVILVYGAIDQQARFSGVDHLLTAIVALLFVVTLQPEFSAFVPGANDNASGAAAVLALGARLKEQPLNHTRLWLVASGAEETGALGPVELLRRHPELKEASWVVLDTIAGPGAGPCVITAEQLLRPLHADPQLLARARAAARARPDLGAYEHYFRGLFSEHSPLAAAGCRSLAIINFTAQGVLPNWHRPTDTFANIDAQVLDRTEQFVWALLQEIDQEA
jgi:Zn-dependent M28 family amino/carboxypeptidase